MAKYILIFRILRIIGLVISIIHSYWINNLLSFFLSENKTIIRRKKLHRKNGIRIRVAAIKLKGLLIKIGQFMSSRVDVLPVEYTSELAQLQDNIPYVDFSKIEARLKCDLGENYRQVFVEFDETPIAAASLGQVHRARLVTGEIVAVKVQYPNIDQVVRCDLKATRIACFLLGMEFKNIRFDLIYREFSRIIKEELNYVHEAQNSEKFYDIFNDDDRIISPGIYWKYTTSHILTMEYVTGIKVSNLEQLQEAGIAKSSVASLISECYLKQVLLHRFFHGDPHPGNIFVQEGPKLVFVDFGLMQRITPDMHQGIKKIIISTVYDDVDGIVRGLIDLGVLTWSKDLSEIREVVSFFMEKYREMKPKEFQDLTVDDIAVDISTVFRIHSSLQIPNSFILFGRAVGLLNGLCTSLDPESNMIELAKPYVRSFITDNETITDKLHKTGRNLARLIFDIPEEMYRMLVKINRGELTTEMTSDDVTGVLGRLHRVTSTVIVVITTFCFIGLYLYLKQQQLQLEASVIGVIAAILLMKLMGNIIVRH